ncbi:MAG TPA: lysylphosphatidylglycerol synthase transmembrane domain-containing protein, partial [Bdellovibrionota bacterium]|nr:lysylphosphatidylglycerol synthase transmembrane domain-containing protein [Bdellovibrionota bacterium]
MKKKLLISIVVGGVCLWLALRGTHWSEVVSEMRNVRVAPLILMFMMLGLTHYFRVRRWRVLLRPIGSVGMKELFGINAVGFLAIHALPFRLGEVTRPLLLKRRHNISLSAGLATIAVERVFDGLMSALLLFVGIYAAPIGFGEMPAIGMGVKTMAIACLGIFLGLLVFLWLAVVHKDRAVALIRFVARLLPETISHRLVHAAHNFLDGLRSLPDLKSLCWIFFESVWVWGVMVAGFWFVLRAFSLDLPWAAPFSILGILAVGITLPNAPGFVGTYQLFVVSGLALYGVPKSTAF